MPTNTPEKNVGNATTYPACFNKKNKPMHTAIESNPLTINFPIKLIKCKTALFDASAVYIRRFSKHPTK